MLVLMMRIRKVRVHVAHALVTMDMRVSRAVLDRMWVIMPMLWVMHVLVLDLTEPVIHVWNERARP